MNKDQQKIYRLQLTDGITTVSLGEYRAAGFADAEKKARTKYKSMFKRLRLPNWKVVEEQQMRGARNEQVRGDVGAIFSPCGQYRYLLWRRWGDGPKMLWIMLNPSTANETDNDPTVERCQRRAVAMGYGAVYVANIFALRSTDPKALRQVDDPVGPDNDEAIQLQANQAEIVVCGWGNHGTLNGRGQRVMQMIREIGVEPHALRVTGAGQPGHPLYVSYGIRPSPLHELQTSR